MDNLFKTTLEPLVEFNNLVAQTTESLTSAHFKNIEVFTKLGLDNFNASMNIRTYDDAVTFVEQQSVLLNNTLIKESKTYTDINNLVFDKTQQFYAKGIKQFFEAGQTKDTVIERTGSSSIVKEPAKKAVVKPTTIKKKATTKPATLKPKTNILNTTKTKTIVKAQEVKTIKAKTSSQPSPLIQKAVAKSAAIKVDSIEIVKTETKTPTLKK